jgi:hypothetical protein
VAGVEGFLDVLAGDLVAAGYAVGVDGEQDTHAVPGAGSDLGGRGAGGQPQRQRSMTQVVGAACPSGACLARDGGGVGLVPDPAMEAFAERTAAGTPEQAPVCGAPHGQEPDRRGEDCAVGPVEPGPRMGAVQHGGLVLQQSKSASLAANDRASRTSQPQSRTKMR